MATLTVSFTPSQNAVKYRIKYRRVGTSAYTTTYVTTSPATITVDCGYNYEGTVEAICVEGIPCNLYQIMNPSMQIDGDVEYTDCVTGNTVTQAITYGAMFTVCSRTEPLALNVPATVTNFGASQSCAQSSPINEEASGPVYWTANAIDCIFYWVVTPCNPESLAVPNGGVVKTSDSTIGIGDVVKLVGSGYVGQDPESLNCYQITDYGTGPNGIVVDDATGAFATCLACQNA